MERQELEKQIAGHPNWYHCIELAPGVVTPGIHDSKGALRQLDKLGLPAWCRGLRVLDIGCRDGFFAFEMEKRGAEVVGLDYADAEVTGFAIASRALGSHVRYLVENVYDLDPETHGRFDLILFLGVLYHLRNPMLALDRIRSVHKTGGALFAETQLANDPACAQSAAPLWQFFPRDSLCGDATNKWAPNFPALAAVVEECLYQVTATVACGERGYVRATAVDDPQLAYFRKLDAAKGLWGR